MIWGEVAVGERGNMGLSRQAALPVVGFEAKHGVSGICVGIHA